MDIVCPVDDALYLKDLLAMLPPCICKLELVNEEFVIAIKMLHYAISFVFNTTTKY